MAMRIIDASLYRVGAVKANPTYSAAKSVLSTLSKNLMGRCDYALSITRLSSVLPKTLVIGVGIITGTTKIKALPVDLPVSRPVSLYDAEGNPVAKTQSALDGSYLFAGLRPGVPYFVVAFDTTNAYRAVVADRVNPT